MLTRLLKGRIQSSRSVDQRPFCFQKWSKALEMRRISSLSLSKRSSLTLCLCPLLKSKHLRFWIKFKQKWRHQRRSTTLDTACLNPWGNTWAAVLTDRWHKSCCLLPLKWQDQVFNPTPEKRFQGKHLAKSLRRNSCLSKSHRLKKPKDHTWSMITPVVSSQQHLKRRQTILKKIKRRLRRTQSRSWECL